MRADLKLAVKIRELEVTMNRDRFVRDLQDVRRNPKFHVLTSASSGDGSRRSQDSDDKTVRVSQRADLLHWYDHRCFLCGVHKPDGKELTRAHVVGANVNCSAFRTPEYSRSFDPKLIHNFILLCGTKGAAGTCHDSWDRHHVSVYPMGLSPLRWRVYAPLEAESLAPLHGREVTFHEDHAVYKRTLAWHYARVLATFADTCDTTLPAELVLNDLSDTQSQVGGGAETSSETS